MRYRAELTRQERVSDSGALGGCILCGTSPHNEGLRLKVLCDQPKANSGPIKGEFQVLDEGCNKHSNSLQRLLGVTTDAKKVIAILRHYQVSPW